MKNDRMLPAGCQDCVFFQHQEGDGLCRRHAPSPSDAGHEPFQFVFWPEVLPDDRCGAGASTRQPGDAELVSCGNCLYWFQPGGVGLRPDYRRGKTREWWEQSGYCIAPAPFPTTSERRGRTAWKVTHVSDSCGDGQALEIKVTQDEDELLTNGAT